MIEYDPLLDPNVVAPDSDDTAVLRQMITAALGFHGDFDAVFQQQWSPLERREASSDGYEHGEHDFKLWYTPVAFADRTDGDDYSFN